MLRVRLITDPFDLAAYSEHKPDALLPFLQSKFETWPETARLYRDSIAVENDITPETEEAVAALTDEGLYYVVVYPGTPLVAIIIGIVAVIALSVAFYLLMPKIPKMDNSSTSSNNALGSRVNKARPNERIPDIFGSVMAIPELLTVPILTFENNVEVEVAYMAVGRGSYAISNVRDGSTPLTLLAGAGAEFYAPGTSPNSGAPQLTVGAPVDAPFRSVYKLNEVNGQQLDPPNHNSVSGTGNIRFVAPNYIENSGGIDFTQYFGPGDEINVTGANFGSSSVLLDLLTTNARFYPDGKVQFETLDPALHYAAGGVVVISNAGFAGADSGGAVVYVDVSGTYTILSVGADFIMLSI